MGEEFNEGPPQALMASSSQVQKEENRLEERGREGKVVRGCSPEATLVQEGGSRSWGAEEGEMFMPSSVMTDQWGRPCRWSFTR